MLPETLEKAWRDRQDARPLAPAMAFGPDGLTLGAGTVLAAVEETGRAIALDEAAEARLQALLAAAYGRPIEPDGGLLMIATQDVLDPMNVDHVRRARIIAEIMIATYDS